MVGLADVSVASCSCSPVHLQDQIYSTTGRHSSPEHRSTAITDSTLSVCLSVCLSLCVRVCTYVGASVVSAASCATWWRHVDVTSSVLLMLTKWCDVGGQRWRRRQWRCARQLATVCATVAGVLSAVVCLVARCADVSPSRERVAALAGRAAGRAAERSAGTRGTTTRTRLVAEMCRAARQTRRGRQAAVQRRGRQSTVAHDGTSAHGDS